MSELARKNRTTFCELLYNDPPGAGRSQTHSATLLGGPAVSHAVAVRARLPADPSGPADSPAPGAEAAPDPAAHYP